MKLGELLTLDEGCAFVPDLPIHAYHAHPAESSTQLKKALLSPAHYHLAKQHPSPPTAAMRLGTAVHSRVLEPHLFAQEYGVLPKGAKAEDLPELAGRILLSAEESALVERMYEAVMSHPTAGDIFAQGVAEQSAFWTDANTGIACRCRPDWMNSRFGIIDLKTARDATATGFAAACANLRYDLSAAFYVDGIHRVTGDAWPFILVAIEKQEPFTCGVYQVSTTMEARGRQRYGEALDIIKRCREMNHWPAWRGSGAIEMINLPAWDR